jgi:MFS family permease
MLNVILFVLGFFALAFALFPWREVVNVLGGFFVAVWISAVMLVMSSISATEKGLRLVGVLVGIILLILALVVGPAVSSGLTPREALDKAIRDFQAYSGLVVDGVFGPDTVKAYYGKRS